jgi:hypothetical protein
MKKCSPSAYSRCPYREYCGDFDNAEFEDGSECDKFNQSVPMTNYDWILSMNEMTMAVFIRTLTAGAVPSGRIFFCEEKCAHPKLWACDLCISRWLKKLHKANSQGV